MNMISHVHLGKEINRILFALRLPFEGFVNKFISCASRTSCDMIDCYGVV